MNQLYQRFKQALRELSSPALILDLEAFYKNLNWVLANSGNKKIRIATKSIRSLNLLRRIQDSSPLFHGFMSFTLEESLWLREQGLKDILLGYPTVDRSSLEILAKNPGEIVLMVDRVEHLDFLEEIARIHHSSFEICLDMDLSLDLPGVRFGVYRSHIHEEKSLIDFLNHLQTTKHLKLVGAMGYEAQIAGVMDEKSTLVRTLKRLSLTQIKNRRASLHKIINSFGHTLRIINGGGTGSLKSTVKDEVVNEITIGSAFFAPVLFDHYQDFKLTPALYFSLPIVRQPQKEIFTILGGGYIASGSTDTIKQPLPTLPEGLSLIKNEGAGEVQTPLKYTGKFPLNVGDPVFLRHAKAGEVCERFPEIHLIEGEKKIETVKTYRGEGKCFL